VSANKGVVDIFPERITVLVRVPARESLVVRPLAIRDGHILKHLPVLGLGEHVVADHIRDSLFVDHHLVPLLVGQETYVRNAH
jgi:hypothetical protein